MIRSQYKKPTIGVAPQAGEANVISGGQPGPLGSIAKQGINAGISNALKAAPNAILGGTGIGSGAVGQALGVTSGATGGLAAGGGLAALAPVAAPLAIAGLAGKALGFFNDGGQVPQQLMEMLQQAPPEVQQAVQAFLQGQIGIEELAQVLQQAGIPPEMIQQIVGTLQQASQPQQPSGPPTGPIGPQGAEGFNVGGMVGHRDDNGEWVNGPSAQAGDTWSPDTFINGKIASVHYPTPASAQNAPVSLNQGGPISINPAKKGEFTNRAQSAGMGTQAYANKVMSAPVGQYSPEVRKQANFARNASKWNSGGYIMGQPHQMSTTGYNSGGPIRLNEGGQLPPEMQQMLASAPPEIQQAVQAFLQGKISPEQLVQVLVEAGIPQQDAMQIVQMASQFVNAQAQGPLAEQPVALNDGGSVPSMGSESISMEASGPVKRIKTKSVLKSGNDSTEDVLEMDFSDHGPGLFAQEEMVPPMSDMAIQALS